MITQFALQKSKNKIKNYSFSKQNDIVLQSQAKQNMSTINQKITNLCTHNCSNFSQHSL